jgi:hypothetical protein
MSFVDFKLLKLEMSLLRSRAGLLSMGMLGIVRSNKVTHCHGPRWRQAARRRGRPLCSTQWAPTQPSMCCQQPAFAAGSDVEDGQAGPRRRAPIMPPQIGHPMSRPATVAGRGPAPGRGGGRTGLERNPAPRQAQCQAAHRVWSKRGATAPAVAGSTALPPARARSVPRPTRRSGAWRSRY